MTVTMAGRDEDGVDIFDGPRRRCEAGNVDSGTHALVEDVDVNNDTYGAFLRVAMTRTLNPKPQGPKF